MRTEDDWREFAEGITPEELQTLTGIKQPPPKTDLERKIEMEIPKDSEPPSEIDSGRSPDEG